MINSISPNQISPILQSGMVNVRETKNCDQSSGCKSEQSSTTQKLSEKEKKQVVELKRRDAEVRTHEQSHKTAGGEYAGAISYTYQKGPDNVSYAIGGTCQISTSEIPNDPEKNINKMQIVKRSALAPMKPSAQDRKIATKAEMEIIESKNELATMKKEEMQENLEKSKNVSHTLLPYLMQNKQTSNQINITI